MIETFSSYLRIAYIVNSFNLGRNIMNDGTSMSDERKRDRRSFILFLAQ